MWSAFVSKGLYMRVRIPLGVWGRNLTEIIQQQVKCYDCMSYLWQSSVWTALKHMLPDSDQSPSFQLSQLSTDTPLNLTTPSADCPSNIERSRTAVPCTLYVMTTWLLIWMLVAVITNVVRTMVRFIAKSNDTPLGIHFKFLNRPARNALNEMWITFFYSNHDLSISDRVWKQ